MSYLSIVVSPLLVMSLLCINSGYSKAQEISKEQPHRIPLTAATVIQNFNDTFKSRVGIGALKRNSKYELDLDVLIRDQKSDIEFDSIRVSCSCGKVGLAGNRLHADRPTTIKVEINTPPSVRQGIVLVGLEFIKNAKVIGQISIRGELEKNLHVTSFVTHLVLRERLNEFTVPIDVSNSIDEKNLVIQKSAELNDLGVELDVNRGEDQGVVRILAHRDSFDKEFTAGKILISDRKSDTSAEIDILVRIGSPLEIAPGILRFRRQKDENQDLFVASAFLKLEQPKPVGNLDNSGSDQILTEDLAVSCYLDGKSVKIEKQKVAPLTYRIKLFLPEQEAEQKSVKWVISSQQGRFEKLTNVQFRN